MNPIGAREQGRWYGGQCGIISEPEALQVAVRGHQERRICKEVWGVTDVQGRV